MEQSSSLLRFNNVSKRFRSGAAVENISFDLPSNKIIGLIGPSGSGKTTAVRLLTGIYTPTDGEVDIMGKSPQDFTTKDRVRIGYLTQHFTLFKDLSVQSNMNFAASIYGQGFLSRRKRIDELLDMVELTDHKNKRASVISGGMQRRLQLAASLVHDPDIIFLDEPTAGIDPILRKKFWDHFESLRDQGKSLFVTTQYVSEASYCDLVGILVDGKLIELEPPEELRKKAFGGEILEVSPTHDFDSETLKRLGHIEGVIRVTRLHNGKIRLYVDDATTTLSPVITWFDDHELEVEGVEHYQPPFDDVFVKLIEDYQAAQEEEVRDEA